MVPSEVSTPVSPEGSLQAPLLESVGAPAPVTKRIAPAVFSALVCVQVASAVYGVVTEAALRQSAHAVNPLIFSLCRDGITLPVLLALAVAFEGPRVPDRRDVGRFLCLGLTGMFLNQFAYILGLLYINAGLASIVNLLTPVISWSLATAVGLEKFSGRQAGGVLLAVAGAMVCVGLLEPATYSRGGGGGGDKVRGSLCVLGSCVTYSLFLLLLKPMLAKYPPVTVTAWSYFSGALCMAFAAAFYLPWSETWASARDPLRLCDGDGGCPSIASAWRVDSGAWGAIATAVLLNSIVKYALTSYANARAPVTIVAIYGCLVPPLTFLAEFAACHLETAGACRRDGNRLAWSANYCGALGVVVGLVVVVRSRDPAPPDPARLGALRRSLLRRLARIS